MELTLGDLGSTASFSIREADKISKPGQYAGYSPERFDGYNLSSCYITVRDGTRLALDIIRPTLNGVLVTEKLPVVWMHMTYNRRDFEGGLTGQTYPGAAMALVKYGYVVAIADMRGSYASFGWAVTPRRAMWMREAYYDAYDITEWLAAQPWSTGKIGMWGCSATGHSQWQAVASAPPSLKAVMPLSAPSEYYDINGVTATAALSPPPYPAAEPPAQDLRAAPVDGDDGTMLAQARDAHRWNLEPGIMPFRDSPSPWMAELLGRPDEKIHLQVSTLTHLPQIAATGIPFYQSANWGEDYRVKTGAVIKHNSLPNPRKTIFVPGKHCIFTNDFKCEPSNPLSITKEAHRWFDYWLKGIDNGIMDEPSVLYYVYNCRDERKAWRFSDVWPLPNTQTRTLFLGAPSPVTAGGVNSGTLCETAPVEAEAYDAYTLDYSVRAENRLERGLSYTSAPFAADTEVIGHPVVTLTLASSYDDADVLAFLYDVAPDGTVAAIPCTDDGQVRASLRALNEPDFNNSGLPYHRCFKEDHAPLTPGAPVEVVFDLAPLAYTFRNGHCLRLVLSCVGVPRPNQPPITPVIEPPPVLKFFRDAARASRIDLPVMPMDTI